MYIKNNRGGALVLVILVMAMLGILGSAFVLATTGEGLQAIGHEQQTQAHYNARSGAYIGFEWLKSEDGIEWINENRGKTEVFNQALDEHKELEISIEDDTVNIKSTGYHKGKKSVVEVTEINPFEKIESEVELPNSMEAMSIFVVGEEDSSKKNDDDDEAKLYIERGDKSTISGDIWVNFEKANTEQIVFDGSDTDRGYDSYKEILPRIDDNNNKKPRKLYIPYTSSENSSDSGKTNSTLKKVIAGEEDSKENLVEKLNIANLEVGIGADKNLNQKARMEIIKQIYPQPTIPTSPDKDKLESELTSAPKSGTTVESSLYIDSKSKDISIKGVVFKGDVVIDAGTYDVDIENCIFEGKLYVTGGEIEIEGEEDDDGEISLFKDKVVLIANEDIDIEMGRFHEDVFIKTDEEVEVESEDKKAGDIDFYKNLYIAGAKEELEFDDKINIAGMLYAPSKNIEFDEEAVIGNCIIANTITFDGVLSIGKGGKVDRVQVESATSQGVWEKGD